MHHDVLASLPEFLETLGLAEEPMGLFHTDDKPLEGFTPKPMALPTREMEELGRIDWREVFGNFSCTMGHIWRARRKKTTAWFSAENFGCPGAAFWLGFMKPQTGIIINYVSSGIPDYMEGEKYCESPDMLRDIFDDIDPVPAPAKYLVIKPLSLFAGHEQPELVTFFSRPESLCGLHQLAFFVTNDTEVVASPWSSGCGSIVVWPMRYLSRGKNKAVIGGWDPSARKFLKADELTFTVPYPMFKEMLARRNESFLSTRTWKVVQQKIRRSKQKWGEMAVDSD